MGFPSDSSQVIKSQPVSGPLCIVVGDRGTTCVYVDWDGPNDPENPINFSKARKWSLTFLGSAFLTLVSASITAYAIAQPSLQTALNVSELTGALGVVIFTLSFGIASLVLAPFSEQYGRLPVYIASAVVFWIMFIPQALAQNFTTVLVTRLVSGIGASTSVAIVGGVLSDIWEAHERGLPMAIFALAAFGGSGLGPACFGYVELSLGFRYVNWILFALSGLLTLSVIIVSKETRAPVLLLRRVKRLQERTGNTHYRPITDKDASSNASQAVGDMIATSLTRPIRMLVTEPVLLLFTMWMTYAWGILYLMLESIPMVFTELYDFNVGESGLVFIGQVIGAIFGLVINIWCDRLYERNVTRKGAEARLYVAMVAGLMLPIGCWIYAWTGSKGIFWLVPVIAICIIYTAMFGIYVACFNYLTDSYTIYASSALSGLSAVRFTCGAMFSLAAQPMYLKLGIHIAGTVLAALSTAFAITPFILFRYGSAIRARSPFARKLAMLQNRSTTLQSASSQA